MALLESENKPLTNENIRVAAGGGSYSTILALRAEIEAEQASPAPDTAQQRRAFEAIWSEAVASGRTQKAAELAEAQTSMAELIAENQRLETELSVLANRVERVEQQRDEMLTQVNTANESTIQARAAGEQYAAKLSKALARIASMQDAHAKAVEQLRRKLEAADTKAHSLELALARAEIRLELRPAA